MVRKAYRNYFEDKDNSLLKYGYFHNIHIIEEIVEEKRDYSTILGKHEAIKYVAYKPGKFEFFAAATDLNKEDKNKKNKDSIKIDIKDMHIIYLVKFRTDGLDEEIVKEFLSFFTHIDKGAPFTNGNKIKKYNCTVGMFNKIEAKSIKEETGEFNLRNIIKVSGDCHYDKITAKWICTSPSFYFGKDNKVDVSGYNWGESPFLFARDNNCIFSTKGLSEEIYIRDNNVLIEPEFDFNGDLYLLPEYPPLAFNTFITSDGKVGDNFIEVKSTENVLLGIKFMYLSNESGLVFKKVIGVEGNKILIDSPIKEKELPVKNGVCFAEPPIENDEIEFKVVKPIKRFSRIVYVSGNSPKISLLGKKISFFKDNEFVADNYVNFYSDIEDLLILRNVVKEKLDVNRAIIEPYKFAEPVTFNIGDNIPNIYVGQKITIDDEKYTVIGFNKNTNHIDFKEVSFDDVKGKSATTDKIEDFMYKSKIIPFTKLKVVEGKKYLDIIKVEKVDGLDEGSKIKLNNKVVIVDKMSEKDGIVTLHLNEPFIPSILDNKIIYKHYYGEKLGQVDIDALQNEYSKFRKDYE